MKPDSSETVYQGRLISLTLERWGDSTKEIVEHPGSTAIVAVDREGFVTLVRQAREAVRAHLLELPAGGLEDDEEPLASAKRELEEETGLSGGVWQELTSFYTTPGFCRERMHLFLAENLERGKPAPKSGEDLEVVRWPVAEIAQRLGEIVDAKTLVGLLLYLRRRSPS